MLVLPQGTRSFVSESNVNRVRSHREKYHDPQLLKLYMGKIGPGAESSISKSYDQNKFSIVFLEENTLSTKI